MNPTEPFSLEPPRGMRDFLPADKARREHAVGVSREVYRSLGFDAIETPVKVDLAAIPRFNESEGHGPKRAHPVQDYFDDLSMHLMWEIYRKDFQLFRYDFGNPANKMPVGDIDLDEVHAKLGD